MKIERLDDNQFRCTFSMEELKERGISLKDMTYGNRKLEALFREMMTEAGRELQFEVGDMALMIEAVPMRTSLEVIVTRVESPDELDTRFARFTESLTENLPDTPLSGERLDSLVRDLKKLLGEAPSTEKSGDPQEAVPESTAADSPAGSSPAREVTPAPGRPQSSAHDIQLYSFRNLDSIMDAAHYLVHPEEWKSSLYKDSSSGRYYLAVHRGRHEVDELNALCNALSEFGSRVRGAENRTAYLQEHETCLIQSNALKKLAGVKI